MNTYQTESERIYYHRIHLVEDYIENNLEDYIENNLNGDLSLDTLASISGFSKFHFHRIFRALTGETLLHYINRIKMERALSLLKNTPHVNVTALASNFGFSETSSFSRKFKEHFSFSPTAAKSYFSKNSQADDKNRQVERALTRYTQRVNTYVIKRSAKMTHLLSVDVVDLPAINTIYLRHTGSYTDLGEMFPTMLGKLYQWAMARQLLDESSKPLAIYHDKPSVTNPEKLRTSICLIVNQVVNAVDTVGALTIESGRYAVAHFELDDPVNHARAWHHFHQEWLPRSGYQPADGLFFEVYVNDPAKHPENKHFIDIYMPVKPL